MRIDKVLVLLVCLSCTIGFAQENDKRLRKANKKYDEFSFVKARKLYVELIEKGYKSEEVYARLGDTYFFNADYKNALVWYEKLMENESDVAPEYNLRYSVCLRANSQHEESLSAMNRYHDLIGKTDENKKWSPEKYMETKDSQSGRYSGVEPVVLNSAMSEFGAVLVPNAEAYKRAAESKKRENTEKSKVLKVIADRRQKADEDQENAKKGSKSGKKGVKKEVKENSTKEENQAELQKYKEIIYTTSSGKGGIVSGKHKWSQRTFSKLYSAELTEDGRLLNGKKLFGDVDTNYSESTAAITKDGLTMYFTRLVPYYNEKRDLNKEKVSKKELAKRKNEISQLRLYQARKKKNKWVDVTELPYPLNVSGSSSAHPALSPNDDLLYFVSNRNKKINDTDIYVVKRKQRGGFDKIAESLGDDINTDGRETFPTVDANGILYFSSDSHPGMGGLDVFAATKDPKGKYVVVNVGEPINSKSDDFSYIINPDTKKGFFSSNRKNEAVDNLYKFTEITPIVFPFKLNPEYFGTIKDTITNELLKEVQIKVYNEQNEMVTSLYTDQSGKFSVDLEPLKNYTFAFAKEKYQIKNIFVEGLKVLETKEIPVALLDEMSTVVDGKIVKFKEGDNLAKVLNLKALYFDYGGYSVRKSTTYELDKIINALDKNPKLSIAIRCYTDSRGRDEFNLKLSKNRAKTIIDYIVHQGRIASERITGEGFGEAQLLNKCSNGVECSEEEHAANRRTDFILHITE